MRDGPASCAAAYGTGVDLDLAAIEHVVAGRPLTPDVARRLDPDIEWAELVEDLRGIGYPVES